ncbi:SCO family protein [Sphingobacteriaceae bacterium WQ 2009]|uniref:SCO family protein n=1 Tax=Rhinopithecimicrobium faecis TaxID=2820698 RepID=A0A8T4HEI3_9SPHI|nr:SCO family protein [Sphingobacteriaceae bacterium WQ 2009]
MNNNTGRNKGISTFLILVIILLVPGFLYFLLNKNGSNTYVTLPIFGEKEVPGTTHRKWGRDILDTIYHQVPSIKFLDVDGKEVAFLANDSIISVAHLMYSNDSSFSRNMVVSLDKVVERFVNNKKVHFYSISVDPKHDTPERLATYAKRFRPLNRKWHFVTAPQTDIFKFAKESLLVDAMPMPENDAKFITSASFILLDSQGRIRGYYDINMKPEVDRLEDEIKLLLVEEIRNKPLKIQQK